MTITITMLKRGRSYDTIRSHRANALETISIAKAKVKKGHKSLIVNWYRSKQLQLASV